MHWCLYTFCNFWNTLKFLTPKRLEIFFVEKHSYYRCRWLQRFFLTTTHSWSKSPYQAHPTCQCQHCFGTLACFVVRSMSQHTIWPTFWCLLFLVHFHDEETPLVGQNAGEFYCFKTHLLPQLKMNFVALKQSIAPFLVVVTSAFA